MSARLRDSRAAFLGFALAMASCDSPKALKVTTIADGGEGSLRAAIGEANRSTDTAVRIELPTGTYQLTRCGNDDSNADGDLDITTSRSVSLIATGPDVIVRQGCTGERVLDDHGTGILTVSGVAITGGSLVGTVTGEPATGGGIRAVGDVVLEHAAVKGNSVTGSPGVSGLAGAAAVAGGIARGGGLFVGGSLVATESTISGNSAVGGPGADGVSADSEAAAGGTGEGGGAFVQATVTLAGGTVESNRAAGSRGGERRAVRCRRQRSRRRNCAATRDDSAQYRPRSEHRRHALREQCGRGGCARCPR